MKISGREAFIKKDLFMESDVNETIFFFAQMDVTYKRLARGSERPRQLLAHQYSTKCSCCK
jgi:hypothetical protein